MFDETSEQPFIQYSMTWDGSLHSANEIVAWIESVSPELENPVHYEPHRLVFNMNGEKRYVLPLEAVTVATTLERHRLDRIHS